MQILQLIIARIWYKIIRAIGDVFKALALNGLGFVLYGTVNIPGFPAEHVLA